MRRSFTEAWATFCLVLIGTGAIALNDITGGQVTSLGISVVFGLMVFILIKTLGPISGAHMNPAVTIAFFAVGRLPGRDLFPYITAQVVGASAGSIILRWIFFGRETTLGVTQPAGFWATALCLEIVLSFILMFVVMRVSTGSHEEGLLAAVVIGGTVALEGFIGSSISSVSMNPARSFAPALVMQQFHAHWIYWVGPIAGTCLGAATWTYFVGRGAKRFKDSRRELL